MNIALLYPGTGRHDALHVWCQTLARHTRQHAARQALTVQGCEDADVVFALTAGDVYPRPNIDDDLRRLAEAKKPFGVLHNETNPPVPSPGRYPSFAWTQKGWLQLREVVGPHLALVPQPCFPPVVSSFPPAEIRVGTFGVCEPKKRTLDMARWAAGHDYPFRVLVPDAYTGPYGDYIEQVRRAGATIIVHPWKEKIEDLAPLVAEVSHFLFCLSPTKEGSGGSSTSPRYATMFNRPVLVVDDEADYLAQFFLAFSTLDKVSIKGIVSPQSVLWTPDAYFDHLIGVTQRFWTA